LFLLSRIYLLFGGFLFSRILRPCLGHHLLLYQSFKHTILGSNPADYANCSGGRFSQPVYTGCIKKNATSEFPKKSLCNS
jgi:hypothetical protein